MGDDGDRKVAEFRRVGINASLAGTPLRSAAT
jgi:hypothetical protein